jgi:hypothetical protein
MKKRVHAELSKNADGLQVMTFTPGHDLPGRGAASVCSTTKIRVYPRRNIAICA